MAAWTVVVSGERAVELDPRLRYGGSPRTRRRRAPRRALDSGVELTPTASDIYVLPTYTAMLELPQDRVRAGSRRPFSERAEWHRSGSPHLYRVPRRLCRSRQHLSSRHRAAGRGSSSTSSRSASAGAQGRRTRVIFFGGGQDREQAVISPDSRRKGARSERPPRTCGAGWPSAAATSSWAHLHDRGTASSWRAPGSSAHTVAGDRRHDRRLPVGCRERSRPEARTLAGWGTMQGSGGSRMKPGRSATSSRASEARRRRATRGNRVGTRWGACVQGPCSRASAMATESLLAGALAHRVEGAQSCSRPGRPGRKERLSSQRPAPGLAQQPRARPSAAAARFPLRAARPRRGRPRPPPDFMVSRGIFACCARCTP